MVQRSVDRAQTVNIDGKNYSIQGSVRRALASSFPQKFVTGDFNEESHPLISTITWKNFSGGALKKVGTFPEDATRYFSGDLNGRIPSHLTMTPPVSTRGASDTAFAGKITHLQEYSGSIYAHAAVDSIATTSSEGIFTVGASTYTFKAGAGPGRSVVDLHSGFADDRFVLASANSTAINWTHSGIDDTTWLSLQAGARATVSWRNKLWFINDSAELSFVDNVTDTTEGFTQVARAQLASSGLVLGLLTDEDNNLFLVAKNGLHLYDNQREQFSHVMSINLPNSSAAAFTAGNGSIFIGNAPSIRQFTLTDGGKIIDEIGLDRDDGVASSYGTQLMRFGAMAVDGPDLFVQTLPGAGSTGKAGVFQHRDGSWHEVHLIASKTSTSQQMLVSSGLLYTGITSTAGQVIVPNAASQFRGINYQPSVGSTSGEFVLPWVLSDNEQTWLATNVRTTHEFHSLALAGTISDSDIITLSYGKDFSETFTTIGSIKGAADGNGSKVFTLPDVDGEGVAFSAFRLKIDMSNGGGLVTPDLNQLSLSFRKNLDPLWGFSMVIDGEQQGFGNSAKETRETLKDLFDKQTLFSFSFKGDAGEEESYQVTAIGFESIEGTGTDESGQFLLRLAEVN